MIHKYFRCGDPSQKCPSSVTKEIIKEVTKDGKDFSCPCANPNCVDFRRPVTFIEGLSGGRSKLVYGAAFLALMILAVLIFGGGSSSLERLRELQARFEPLKSAVSELGTKSTLPKEEKAASLRVSAVERGFEELKKEADDALATGSASAVAHSIQNVDQQISIAKHTIQTFDQPVLGMGVNTTEAKLLLAKFQELEEDAETALEPVHAENPDNVAVFEDFIGEVKGAMTKARQLATPSAANPSSPESEVLKKKIQATIDNLTAIRTRLAGFTPAPVGPWAPAEAGLRIAASGELARDLVGPLIAAWAGTGLAEGPDGRTFLTSVSKGKMLVETLSVEEGFSKLAGGEITVFFADRAPTESEMEQFGPGFKASRSVAEVVALDAMSLLVNPEVSVDTFEIGKSIPLRMAAGPASSGLRQRADMFGITSTDSLDIGGEQAALSDPNVMALGLYHTEGTNLRAKRLAVKASPEAMALKPSPFSIATEDYRFSYRIIAWTTSKPTPDALELVKFITSDAGQSIVAEKGFVDLRLRPMPGDVPPEIMAALGAALGVDKVTSALRLSTNFRFEVGDARLDLKAQADLERLPRFVAESYPTHKLVILGFTDMDGGPEINMPLSKNRAEAVAADLRKSKVDTRSGGLGPAFPIDSNATDSGKAKNRRAEVWVVMP